MKLINKQTDYALQALLNIAKSPDKIVSSADLYESLGLPRAILRKVLQILQKEGILDSTKGSGGGFKLATRPEKIFLLDLINIFEGKVSFVNCLFRKRLCAHRATCPIRKRIKAIELTVIEQLKNITLKQLLEDVKA